MENSDHLSSSLVSVYMSETAAENQVSQTQQPVNKVKRTTNALLALTMVSIGTAIVADRIIPTTDNVRVEGNVVSLIPQVSGQVDSISIKPNTEVKKGDVLLQINTTDHQIAVKQAEAKLKIAGQNVGSQMAGVMSAQAQLTTALVAQENAKRQGQRVLAMAEKAWFQNQMQTLLAQPLIKRMPMSLTPKRTSKKQKLRWERQVKRTLRSNRLY